MKPVLYSIVFLLLLSCNSGDDAATPNQYAAKFVRDLNTSDTFLCDNTIISKEKSDSSVWKYFRHLEKNLKLPVIDKGFDSIQIRLVFGWSIREREKLVILKNNRKGWVAEVSEIRIHYDSSYEKIDSISRMIAIKDPKSGWVELINKMFELKILSLPDIYEIPGYERHSVMDGCTVGIEVATKNAYRCYGYENTDYYGNKYWQTANINKIQDLLYAEFPILVQWNEENRQRIRKEFLKQEIDREINNLFKKKGVISKEIIIRETGDSVNYK